MENSTLSYDSNIISARLANNNLSIQCKKPGETTITIKPQTGSHVVTYNIKISNIVTSIAKNLDSALILNVGDKKTISFSANETNNVYTWYFSKMKKVKW